MNIHVFTFVLVKMCESKLLLPLVQESGPGSQGGKVLVPLIGITSESTLITLSVFEAGFSPTTSSIKAAPDFLSLFSNKLWFK